MIETAVTATQAPCACIELSSAPMQWLLASVWLVLWVVSAFLACAVVCGVIRASGWPRHRAAAALAGMTLAGEAVGVAAIVVLPDSAPVHWWSTDAPAVLVGLSVSVAALIAAQCIAIVATTTLEERHIASRGDDPQ